MSSALDKLVDQWLYNIEHILSNELEAPAGYAESGDEHTRENAEKEILEILHWLYPPGGPLSDDGELRRTREALNDESVPLQPEVVLDLVGTWHQLETQNTEEAFIRTGPIDKVQKYLGGQASDTEHYG
jgi:hypothetical protein